MTFFYDLNKRLAALAGKQEAQQIAESKQTESIAQSPLTRALNEGSMKHAMHKDAERMSREKFCAKWGDENGEFWDNISGDLNEGSMKDAMWHDAERMNRNQFCSKWGQEHGEFWDNISGDLAESKENSVVAKLAPYAEKIAMIADKGASAIEQDPTMLDNENDAAQTAKALRTVANLFRQDVGQGLAAVVKKLWAEPREMLVGEVKQRLKIDLAKLHNRAFPDADVQFENGYSAKKGAAGKDLGKPGKNFAKIASKSGGGEKGQRIAGAVLNKLRGKTEEAVAPMTPKQKSFAKLAPPTDKITFADKIAGAKKEVDEMLGDVAAEAIKSAIGRGKQQVADEGNAFTGALAKTPKGSKFKVGSKEFTDNSDIEEGFADMDAWLASREKEKGTGKFDKRERTLPGGMKATTYTRKHEDDKEDDSDAPTSKGGAPKKRGRPMGKPKGPERTTAKAWKHKGERKVAEEGDEHVCEMCGQTVVEKAKSKAQQKFMGMVHSAQKGEKPASKEVAKVAKEMPKKASKDFAATKHKGLPNKVKKESTDKEDNKAEKAGKKVTKDIEYDDKKDKETDRSKVKKDIAADRIQNKIKSTKDKEEKVDETTTSGSVATATSSGKSSSGGMQFGKGVYEGINNSIEKMISEGITVESRMEECGDGNMAPGITVTADGEEAAKLMMLLKLAGLDSQIPSTCPTCGNAPCNCAEVVDENSPNWPTNTETSNNALQYSGGLNKPKSTGQTTTPVIANQGRQTSMEESVKLERSLFNTWKNYKG